MGRSCFQPTNSCTCCAPVLSLVTAHRMTPTRIASSNQRSTRRLRRGGVTSAGAGTSTTAGVFGGELTGLPHFRQNCASSGRLAPHLLHPNRTLVEDDVVLFVGILTGSRRFQIEVRTLGRKCQQILAQVRASDPYPRSTFSCAEIIQLWPRFHPSRVCPQWASKLRCRRRCAHPDQRPVRPRPG